MLLCLREQKSLRLCVHLRLEADYPRLHLLLRPDACHMPQRSASSLMAQATAVARRVDSGAASSACCGACRPPSIPHTTTGSSRADAVIHLLAAWGTVPVLGALHSVPALPFGAEYVLGGGVGLTVHTSGQS